MEFKQLRFFVKVSELSSMRAASEELHITQPALGMQIRNLEENLGVSLFDRHSRGVNLTSAGEQLRKHAEIILQNMRIAEDDLKRFGDNPSGVIKIGVTPSIGRVLIPEMLEICTDRHPYVELSLTQAFSSELDIVFEAGRLDMSFSMHFLDTKKHESLPLFKQAMFLIGSQDKMKNLKSPVGIDKVVSLPLVLDGRTGSQSRAFKALIEQRGLKLENVLGVAATNIRREIVLTSGRCTIAPYALFDQEIASGQLCAMEIEAPSLVGTLYLNTRRIEEMTKTEEAIRQLVIELIDGHIENQDFLWELPMDN